MTRIMTVDEVARHLRGVVPAAPAVDERAVARRLREHLRKEEARVAEFVSEPSIERLYCGARTG